MERDEGRGRVALVTGGASGIGLVCAEVLIARGWRVAIGDVDRAGCVAVAERIGAHAAPFDVADEAASEAAFVRIEAEIGPVEALMANAGLIQPGAKPEELPLAEFDRIMSVNLRGVYLSCLGGGRRMALRGQGAIVVTGSVTASRTAPLHAYAPSKAAAVHLAACLAAEWGRSGVRVNSVSPGYVATPPLQAAIDSGRRDQALLEQAAALGRMVRSDEVARGVAFLLSDDASAVTGIDLPIDCGWLAAAHLSTYGGVPPARAR